LSNDTSLGVGYAPTTKLEKLVLNIEAELSSVIFKKDNPWIGSDIKILGFKNNENYLITLCIPQIANFVKNIDSYKRNLIKTKEKIFKIATKHRVKSLEVNMNTRDDFETMELYLTATGSSIESGDEGLVGRGNRINGVISPMKPLSMEGAENSGIFLENGVVKVVGYSKIAIAYQENKGATYLNPGASFKL